MAVKWLVFLFLLLSTGNIILYDSKFNINAFYSTITTWSKEGEADAFRNIIEKVMIFAHISLCAHKLHKFA